MSKQVILTGLRANNDLHIGNYFGALLPIIDMAKSRSDEYDINLFVPDLHSFTTPIDHSQLQQQIMHNLKLFVAAGLPLDTDNIHIYRQSYVPAHSELTWILDCFTGFGELRRMTQFKEKGQRPNMNGMSFSPAIASAQGKEVNFDHVGVGLFNYPVLMAADILLYGANYVPVGDDQSQHLEFARDIAERMNSKFSDLFVVPEAVQKQHEFFGSAGGGKEGNHQGLRIKDLVDPSRKMSKSEQSDRGVIFLGDSPEDAAKKVMGATTDSVGTVNLDYENQPGISNLLQIQGLLSGQPLEAVAGQHAGQQSYGELKQQVADQIRQFLTDFQSKLGQVDENQLHQKLEADEAAMNQKANETLYKVQKAVGLR